MRTATLLLFAAACVCGADRYSITKESKRVILKDASAQIEATVVPEQGGEVCGIRIRHRNEWRELLYRGCDYGTTDGWRGKAPLLWPATGGTLAEGEQNAGQRQGTYSLGDAKYKMPFHGFVMTMPWELVSASADPSGARARVRLRDNAETRKHYPFGWTLEVDYLLANGTLSLQYAVNAAKQNGQKMVFSIGNHITFKTPLVPGSKPGDLTLDAPAGAQLLKDARNFPNGQTKAPPASPAKLSDFPALGVVSLGAYKSDPYVVLTDPQGIRIRMSHSTPNSPPQPFVQFNLWGDPDNGYFSPEPWVGAQNSFNTRRGLVELAPGSQWKWRIDIQPGTF